MAEQQKSPFARVPNGYDPKQVAAFAAEALSWKKELATLRSEVAAGAKLVERYETVIGTIDEVEHEAAGIVEEAQQRAAGLIEEAKQRATEIVEEAEDRAAEILEMARDQVAVGPETEATPDQEPADQDSDDGESWLNPVPVPDEIPDVVEQIFEPVEQVEVSETDVSLERRAAGAANLWKRRGLVAPSE